MSDITITVLTRPSCVQCDQTKRHLTKRGIPFIEKPIHDPAKVAEETGFQRAPIVLVTSAEGQEEAFSGYRPDHLDQLKGLFA